MAANVDDATWNEALAILTEVRTNVRATLEGFEGDERPFVAKARAQCERIEALLRRAGVSV